MSAINLEKIDKFYFALFGVMVLLAVIVIFTFQTVISSLVLAYEVEVDTSEADLKVNKEELDSAYTYIFETKTAVPVQIEEQEPDDETII